MITKEDYQKLPEIIQLRIMELDKLIEQYPYKIPTVKAAEFLKMDVECFRKAVEQGKLPFALGCDNSNYGNRYSYVSSLTFYLWCVSPIL